MAAKAEAPAKPDAAAAAAPAAAPAAKKGGIGAWIPTIAVVILAPVLTFATVEFVLVPRLQKKLTAAASPEAIEAAAAAAEAEHAAAPAEGHGGGHGGKEGKEGKEGASPNFEFANVVVNLAGTMGTRYLKTSFIVTGPNEGSVKGIFEAQKPRLTDVTLNVLSSLTLSDLEEPGAKNVIREKLVNAYNQALGKKVVDQVYFSDFVIQ